MAIEQSTSERGSQMLTTHALAERLGVNVATVRIWAKSGRIPALRSIPRGRIRFDLS